MAAIENIPPSSIRRIAGELRKLTLTPADGVKLIPNEGDITDIQAFIEGPVGTPYEGGTFRVKLKLGPEFPQAPPKGYFVTKIFHPNVAKNGEICVNTLKKDWKEELGIEHVLVTIKCLLIAPNPESSLNEEAGRLLLEQYDDYARRARLITNLHAKPQQPTPPPTHTTDNNSADDTTTTTTTTSTSSVSSGATTTTTTATATTATTTTTHTSGGGGGGVAKKAAVPGAKRAAAPRAKTATEKKKDEQKKSLKRL
eukprot:TRINITY_DN6640_c1_g1_i1.p1 TRINITY_DN6640_c1_g1~~TRINITY_DN6640_c1_g1_i1.p1  ORF type:complete len:255 (+),score=103.37 TRINITY_DN6640_c1_g1_i1:86-850(+)